MKGCENAFSTSLAYKVNRQRLQRHSIKNCKQLPRQGVGTSNHGCRTIRSPWIIGYKQSRVQASQFKEVRLIKELGINNEHVVYVYMMMKPGAVQ